MHPSIALQQLRGTCKSKPSGSGKPHTLRFNWFIIGSLFGVGVSFLLNIFITTIVLPSYDFFVNQQTAQIAALEAESVEALAALAPAAGNAEKTVAVLEAKKDASMALLPTYPQRYELEVPKGGTLLNMLMAKDVSREKAYEMVTALGDVYSPRQIRAGQKMELVVDRNPMTKKMEIDSLTIKLSKIAYVEALRDKQGFDVAKKEISLEPETTLAGGTITSSLFETGYEHGVPSGVLAEMVQAFSYDVDFQRDIQTGAKMEVLFDHMLDSNGEKITYGDVHYAMLDLGGKPIKIYRFQDAEGYTGYFEPNGHSVVKSLLKTPVNGARMSSGFGPRRHPILGYNKMHKGVDFAAPTGTPIYAAGDGKVEFAGRRGGYGNYVKIRHNDNYATAYAHAHRFAKGIKNGTRVKQGQVIAYVGTTGRSTGPHLHYEVLKNGKQVNPKKVNLPTGKVLKGDKLEEFKRFVARTDRQIASMARSGTKVASAQ